MLFLTFFTVAALVPFYKFKNLSNSHMPPFMAKPMAELELVSCP